MERAHGRQSLGVADSPDSRQVRSSEEAAIFEAVQFIEYRTIPEPEETLLGEFHEEMDAVEVARAARDEFLRTDADEYAWWIVRQKGARLANFIADSKTKKEFVLDLTTGQLVEV